MSCKNGGHASLNEEVNIAYEFFKVARLHFLVIINVALHGHLEFVLVYHILLNQLQLGRVAVENALCNDLTLTLPRVRNEVVHARQVQQGQDSEHAHDDDLDQGLHVEVVHDRAVVSALMQDESLAQQQTTQDLALRALHARATELGAIFDPNK